MEMDYDERDRMREKDELEELRLQVIASPGDGKVRVHSLP